MSDQPKKPAIRYFGDYILLGEIARGGMGVVYHAVQSSLDREVAIKMIDAGNLAGEAAGRRFQTEAEAMAQLDHPNIVSIYEVGEHEGQCYLAVKLIEGNSLAEQIAEGRWNIDASNRKERQQSIARLMATVAGAVHHAHQRGVLHRDIKPGNILLDEEGEPHVTDFGLAKLTENDVGLSQTGAVLGTPSYMAPEQAAGKTRQITTATDVYGLGVVLYELLAGERPFHSDDAFEIMRRVVQEEPRRPRSHNPLLDRDLETICLKCLEKEQAARYQSAEALAGDLQRWLEGRPIHARPVGPIERGIKWAKRRPAVATVSLGIPLSVVGILTLVWLWNQTSQQVQSLHRRSTVLEKQLAAREFSVSVTPQYHRVELGGSVTLAAVVKGSDTPQYQWRHNGTIIEEGTNQSLKVDNVQATDGGRYSVTVKDVNSSNATASASILADTGEEMELWVACGKTNEVRRYSTRTGEFLGAAAAGCKLTAMQNFGVGPDGATYVAAPYSNAVFKYDRESGQCLGEFVTHKSGVLTNPIGLTFGLDGSLYVANWWGKVVNKFDGKTGELIQKFRVSFLGGNDLEIGPDGEVYVSNYDGHGIDRLNQVTGSHEPFVRLPESIARSVQSFDFAPDGLVYVCDDANGPVLRCDARTGVFVDTAVVAENGSCRTSTAVGLDGILYVCDRNVGIKRYHADSGEFIDTFIKMNEKETEQFQWIKLLPARSAHLEEWSPQANSIPPTAENPSITSTNAFTTATNSLRLAGTVAVPKRSPRSTHRQIDLGTHFNASLQQSWQSRRDSGNNLAALPTGFLDLAGTAFEVRGIVQLASSQLDSARTTGRPNYPRSVLNIGVNSKFQQVHFLHGAAWISKTGTPIGRYVIHFSDGSSSEQSIIYGKDVRNWQFWPDMPKGEQTGGTVAWVGTQERWKQSPGFGVRLYKSTWVNPKPDLEITHIDFESIMTASAPFLLSITGE